MSALLLGVIAAGWISSSACAGVITGPTLNQNDEDYIASGLGFTATVNTTLTSFTFENQGQADTVDLVTPNGNILYSVAVPSGVPSDTVSVSWALTSGSYYYLLQTTLNNGVFADWNMAAPSDAQIALTDTGDFTMQGTSNPLASANFTFGGSAGDGTSFWVDFNNITTGAASSTPEPASSVLVIAALAAFWQARRKGLIRS